jgi:hypothetical protein
MSKKETTRVTFTFYLKGDMDNWWAACQKAGFGIDWKMRIPPNLRRRIAGVKYEKAVKFLKPYLKNLYKSRKKHIRKLMNACSTYWADNEKEIFKRLKKITKHPIWPERIYCFYTSFPRGPYGTARNHAWLYITEYSLKDRKRCASVILHEIVHFQFHKYFWVYCEKHGLNDQQTQHLKEAVTFLINEEFSDLVLHDKGYPIHKKLRAELRIVWRKDKNFGKVLDRGIFLIKNKYTDLSPGGRDRVLIA